MQGLQLQQVWNESLESEIGVILALGTGRRFKKHDGER